MSENTTSALFVYGALLRPAMHHDMHEVLRQGSVRLGPAILQAKLYDIGAFPGAVLSHDKRDWVQGEAFRMLRPARLLHLLDQFEDCTTSDPKPHRFVRHVSQIQLRSARRAIAAWVYLYNWDVSRARMIINGRYELGRGWR